MAEAFSKTTYDHYQKLVSKKAAVEETLTNATSRSVMESVSIVVDCLLHFPKGVRVSDSQCVNDIADTALRVPSFDTWLLRWHTR